MFILIYVYRARAGEADAVVALHEDWQRRRSRGASGFVSGELLSDLQDPQSFIEIARFEDEAAAQAMTQGPERRVWFQRLASLTEAEPRVSSYQSAWQIIEELNP